MFLFPESPIPSPPQEMRRHFLQRPASTHDVEEMLEDMRMMEMEYKAWKEEVRAKMKRYEQTFSDYEYVLNKILVDQQTKKDS